MDGELDDYTEFKKEFMRGKGVKCPAPRANEFMYLLDGDGDIEQHYEDSKKREQRCRDSSPKRKQQMKESYAQYIADLQDGGMDVSEAQQELMSMGTMVEKNPYVIRHSHQSSKYYGKSV